MEKGQEIAGRKGSSPASREGRECRRSQPRSAPTTRPITYFSRDGATDIERLSNRITRRAPRRLDLQSKGEDNDRRRSTITRDTLPMLTVTRRMVNARSPRGTRDRRFESRGARPASAERWRGCAELCQAHTSGLSSESSPQEFRTHSDTLRRLRRDRCLLGRVLHTRCVG